MKPEVSLDDITIENTNNDLPSSWTIVRLGDLCKTTSGGTPSRKNMLYYKGNIPWLKSGELENNIITSSEEHITKNALENSSSKMIPKGAILIALYGATVGKLAILGIDASINQAICAIFPPNGIESKYLYWYLFGYRNELLNSRKGGAQPNISQQIVNNIIFPLPPLNEQRRIVAKIEEQVAKLEAGIEYLTKTKILLKKYHQSVLKFGFEGKLTEKWRIENKEKIDSYESMINKLCNVQYKQKLEKINEMRHYDKNYPKEWVFSSLGRLCKLITKGESPNWQGYQYVEDGVTFIRSENVLYGTLDVSNAVNIPKEFHNKLKRSQLKPLDVLINLVGASIGRCAVVPHYIENANINQAVALVRVHEILNPIYLMYLLLSPQLQEKIHQSKVETARPNVSLINLNELIIPVPSIHEQQEIVNKIETQVSMVINNEDIIKQSLMQANTLRKAMLETAFKGRLVPQDPLDEHGEILLQKIRQEKANSQVHNISKKSKFSLDNSQRRLI